MDIAAHFRSKLDGKMWVFIVGLFSWGAFKSSIPRAHSMEKFLRAQCRPAEAMLPGTGRAVSLLPYPSQSPRFGVAEPRFGCHSATYQNTPESYQNDTRTARPRQKNDPPLTGNSAEHPPGHPPGGGANTRGIPEAEFNTGIQPALRVGALSGQSKGSTGRGQGSADNKE